MAIDTIGTNAIANDAVTAAKIPAGAVDADITAIPDGSVTTAKIADNAVTSAKALNLGRRNLIINGAMQIAQRATSATGIGTANAVYPTVDRMIIEVGNTAGRLTMTQESITDLPGFTKAVKLACTTADTSIAADEFLMLGTRLEGQNLQHLKKGTSSAEKVTVSFYVKGNANATYTCELRDQDNTRFNNIEFSVTSSWTRVSLTFDGDTTGAFDNDANLSLKCNLFLHGGSTYSGGSHTNNVWHTTHNQRLSDNQTSFFDSTSRTLFVTGWQLEVGETATDFEHRSFGEELLLCQRYYEHTYPYGTAAGSANGGIGADHRYVGRSTGNNYGYFTGHYRVEKRAAATVTVYSYVGTANQIAHGDTGSDSGAVGVIQNGTTSFLPRNTSGSGVSERALLYHFRADAEL